MNERLLYLGLDPSSFKTQKIIVHYPIIKIAPKSFENQFIQDALNHFHSFTHILITSKSSIKILKDYLNKKNISIDDWNTKQTYAVGKVTAKHLQENGIHVSCIAQKETAEGLIEEVSNRLKNDDVKKVHFFWPHSSLGRAVIPDFFNSQHIHLTACDLYDTIDQVPEKVPNLNDFHEIVFTSPSTVDAFIKIFKIFPTEKKLTAIGPITEEYLRYHTCSNVHISSL
ncbi:MAG: uroporphyrinogen-III synthase [Parachlamydiaceae bacterium]|nr:uroporphyrinogen-III synthase [Parachlamydiaceae bacterium]